MTRRSAKVSALRKRRRSKVAKTSTKKQRRKPSQLAALKAKLKRRTEELNGAREQQTATAEVLKVISRASVDLQMVLDTLVERVAPLCRADRALMYRLHDDAYHLVAEHGLSAEARQFGVTHPLVPGRGSAAGRAAQEGRPVHIPDVLADPEYTYAGIKLTGTRTLLSVPLLREGGLVGIFTIQRTRAEPFTDKEIELVATFADQAVIAIENARLFNETKEALERQTATADILQVIANSSSDVQPVFDTIADSARRLSGGHTAIVTQVVGDFLHLRASSADSEAGAEELRATFPIPLSRDRLHGRAALSGEIAFRYDAEDEPDVTPTAKKTARARGFRSLIVVPMMRESVAIGTIGVSRQEAGHFPDSFIELLRTFADQAVIAIENVRLFEEVNARTEDLRESLQQQTATADVLKVISRSTFHLDIVLNALTASAASLCAADMAAVTRPHAEGGYYHATRYNFPAEWDRISTATRVYIDRGSLVGRVLLEGKTVQIPDVLADPEYSYPEQQKAGGYRTLLGVPLLREGKPTGVLFLGRMTVKPFSEKQIELVQTFADQAVIAIENVRLFDEVQAKTRDLTEALSYQTGSANILKVIASSPTDIKPVLDAIVESACELCGAYDTVLRLKKGDELQLAAHHGRVPADWELVRINPYWTAGRAALDQRPVHVHDMSSAEGDQFPEAQARARDQGHRTILSVPLLQEGNSIGTLTLRRFEVNPFTDKQIALLQTFADQAVIAIGNVRLFEEVQARTHELAESLEQQTATSEVLSVISRSAGDLGPVFDAMLSKAMQLCGANFGVLNTYDGARFHTEATYGLPAAYDEFRRKQPLEYGPATAPARLLAGEPFVEVYDLLESDAYRSGEPNRRALVDLGNARCLLAVPLLKDQRVVGNVMIFRQENRQFSEKQITLLQQFAAQAVIAIENARLLNELRQRTEDLSKSLDDLRTAQDRLIQTEKLASLGQLTAGIAHEIKNPLNFVNNFSAVSAELVDEVNDVLRGIKLDLKPHQELEELTALLKSNLEKVVQHGKRADSIVKNMLLHSREGSGEQRAADINALVDESLNLAYHGARAEKSGFNITLQRDFDTNAGSAELFPQEITRALLNLISNGFYAATKRKNEDRQTEFEPTLRATTKSLGSTVEIRIRDNGAGIPPEVKEKMFNPFFTTKPAGEGTGLGLSMTHDIVVKQHGGRIDVVTEPGQFTEFTIVLPRSGAKQ